MPRRIRIKAKLAVAAVALTTAAWPAGAGASARDAASTHAYVAASYALARSGIGYIHPVLSRIARYQRQLAAQCPGAAAGSPQNEEDHMLGLEAAGALWSIEFGTAHSIIRRYARAVAPLRWSNPAITRTARAHAKNLLALAALPHPDLCADTRAWSASGFRTLAPATLAYDRLVEATEGHPTVSQRLLAPYESAADRRLAAQTARLERKLLDTETVIGYNDWLQVLETLGLNQ